MKKFLKILLIVAVLLVALGYGGLTYMAETRRAAPAEDALAALVTDGTVAVEFDDWLVMRPAESEPDTGLIVYPGASCDIRGYAPVLRELAARGYLVVGVTMPFDFSIFAPNRADAVRAAFPEINEWVIAGHSMGGAMASQYAHGHQQDLAGVILWDSYPPEPSSLADTSLPVAHIHRATLDGKSSQVFLDKKYLFPEDSLWVPIPGGNHMNFGSFTGGGYVEEWDAVIDRDTQHEIVIAGTAEALAFMTGD